VSAFHYLLKPIEEKKFEEVFDRAVKEVGMRKAQEQDVFFIKTRNRNITLDRKTILYVENQGKKVEIHTTAEIIEIYASMKELELQLGESFCRCHRGYLVNMAYIAEYENDSIRLSNGEKIFMAKERYHEFVKKYMRYLRSGGTVYV
jgi:DNA-binding LytR/AlgR family response regulator